MCRHQPCEELASRGASSPRLYFNCRLTEREALFTSLGKARHQNDEEREKKKNAQQRLSTSFASRTSRRRRRGMRPTSFFRSFTLSTRWINRARGEGRHWLKSSSLTPFPQWGHSSGLVLIRGLLTNSYFPVYVRCRDFPLSTYDTA